MSPRRVIRRVTTPARAGGLISVVIEPDSWIVPYAKRLARTLRTLGHPARVCEAYSRVPSGRIAFYLGCTRIVPPELLRRNERNLAVHESDLPQGRGFAPIAWQVLAGASRIPMVLFEVVEAVDAGPIYLRKELALEGHELMPEIRAKQGELTVALCLEFVRRYPRIQPRPQRGSASYFPRRRPADSRLDLDVTLREQMALLRIVDNERYPAFFDHQGWRYTVTIAKVGRAHSPARTVAEASTHG